MKRQVQGTGIRDWYGDDWVDMQNEVFSVLDSFFAEYGNMVISGCQVDGNSINPGIVGLNGADGYKVCRFGGAQDVSVYPVYLYQEKTEIKDQYDTGDVKAVQYVYEAKITNSLPAGDYVRLEANGTKKMFRDAMQSAAYRLVTDAMISNWNGIEARAKADATTKANAAKDYAGQIADDTLVSAVQYANAKKTEAIAEAATDATNKANSAENNAKSYADNKVSIYTPGDGVSLFELNASRKLTSNNLGRGIIIPIEDINNWHKFVVDILFSPRLNSGVQFINIVAKVHIISGQFYLSANSSLDHYAQSVKIGTLTHSSLGSCLVVLINDYGDADEYGHMVIKRIDRGMNYINKMPDIRWFDSGDSGYTLKATAKLPIIHQGDTIRCRSLIID